MCRTLKKLKHIQKFSQFPSPDNGHFVTLHVTNKFKYPFLYEAIIEENVVKFMYV